MVELILSAVGYGLLLSVMVGPAFFVLIETSILKGVKSALFLDLGVLISDIIYVVIAFFFFSEVTALMESDNRFILKICGGAFFVAFGLLNILKKKVPFPKKGKAAIRPEDLKASNFVMMILKGFTINLINPGVLFYWLTLMSIIPEPEPHLGLTHEQNLMINIGIILVAFFSLDVLKIIGAKKLKDILTPSWMRVVNLMLGIILLLFGLMFVFQGVFALWK